MFNGNHLLSYYVLLIQWLGVINSFCLILLLRTAHRLSEQWSHRMISYHLEQQWQRTQVNTLVNWVVLIFWSIGPVGNVTFISYYDPMWWFLPLVCITAWNRLLFLVVIIIEWNNPCRRSGNNESISTIWGNWVVTA